MKIELLKHLSIYTITLILITLSCASKDVKETANGNIVTMVSDTDNGQEEDFSGNSTSDVSNPAEFVGQYNAYISSYKASIKIYTSNNKFYGEIRFEKWGNGKPQPLKNLNISGKKIYFVRSISTDKEMKDFGSSRKFRQQFHGNFSDDMKTVKGYYLESGAEASWWAEKE